MTLPSHHHTEAKLCWTHILKLRKKITKYELISPYSDISITLQFYEYKLHEYYQIKLC